MVSETCKLSTSKGVLTINFYSEIPNLCKLFRDLVSKGAYSGCKFSRITKTYIQLQAPQTATKEVAGYFSESHTLVKYGKRGTVTLMPDLSVVITIGTSPPSAIDGGSIIGVCSPDSVYVVQEIASASVLEGSPETPQFPVHVSQNDDSRSIAAQLGSAPTAVKQKKNRIRMFEDAEKLPVARKFKRNPNVKESADPLLERLKAFEAALGNM